jgi:uncharacterized protein
VSCAAGLSLLDIRPPARSPAAAVRVRLERLGPWLFRRRGWVRSGFAATAALLLAGASQLVVDTHTIGLLPSGHPVVRDSEWIETNLGLYTPLEFVVRPPGGDALAPATLAALRAWQETAESRRGVDRTLALPDLLTLTRTSSPGTAEEAAAALEAWAEASEMDAGAYLGPGRATTRATAFVPMGTARQFAAATRALAADGDRALGAPGAFIPAGYLPLYVRIIDYTVSSTLMGLGLALLAVFLVLALLLGSARLVLAAVPPNLFAIAAVFGVMGWLRIPLDIATATVGAIVIGIAVDNTVHYLHRYRSARAAGDTDAAATALLGAGPAMVLSSVVLVLGLAILMAAGSRSIVYFGLLTSVAVAAALAADLLLLPTLVGREARQPRAERPPSLPDPPHRPPAPEAP